MESMSDAAKPKSKRRRSSADMMSDTIITIDKSQACLKKRELDDMSVYRVHQIALMERQNEMEEHRL